MLEERSLSIISRCQVQRARESCEVLFRWCWQLYEQEQGENMKKKKKLLKHQMKMKWGIVITRDSQVIVKK